MLVKLKPIISTKGTDWKHYTGEEFPEGAKEFAEKNNIFRSGYAGWFREGIYYKGDSHETAKEWIIVMDDGGYYKVNAIYMMWYTRPEGDGCGSQCAWSAKHLKKTLRSLLTTGKTLFDPGYTT